MNDDFLYQQARTQHFTLGSPHSFALSEDGSRLFFIRSKAEDDPQGCLWVAELVDGTLKEKLVADPHSFTEEGELPEAERRRRERAREQGAGIVSFSIDKQGKQAVFTLGGDLYLVALSDSRAPRCLLSGEGVYDPRLSPDGQWVAFVSEGSLRLVATAPQKSPVRTLATDDGKEVTWGLADFIAAEEMERLRGFWWAPDSQRVLAEYVDTNPVQEWFIAHPDQPSQPPTKVRYPAAGTPNAKIGLSLITLEGQRQPVKWDTQRFEYLARVSWQNKQPLLAVQSRDQKTVHYLTVNVATGDTEIIQEITDPQWVELIGGFPAQLHDGTLVTSIDHEGRRLQVGGKIATPPELIVRSLQAVQADGSLIFSAYESDPKCWHLWERRPDGSLQQLTHQAGIHSGIAKGETLLCRANTLTGATTQVLRRQADGSWQKVGEVADYAAQPPLKSQPQFFRSHHRHLESAVLLPEGYSGDQPLPVILDPYGGPHAQRVLMARAYLGAQWVANQGFAVVITDGRGSPGRGPEWEKALAGDIISPVLEDQIEALQDILAHDDRLDATRVGISGWSFGGYLAAFAVVRHPEVFHAAVAGAPVTDWRLYDTHYTERYLGDPAKNATAYDKCSLLKEAAKLERPLLLIHGLADDNVVVAHSLQFSSALLAAGRTHAVLPLSGATHMASGETLAVNLQKLELEFFRQHLRQAAASE